VPTINRELKARPAITSWSAITILRISLYSARTARGAIPAGLHCQQARLAEVIRETSGHCQVSG
jgi:hypothetical protein